MKIIPNFTKSLLFTNSFWGIATSLFQNIFFTLFFIIIARKYSTTDFAYYLIANALYQLIAAFSSFGLGHWFVREIIHVSDKQDLIHRFIKIQLCFSILFYFVNLIVAYLVYDNHSIHLLAITFGVNIVFDALITSIKFVNIAELDQKKTFVIFLIDAFLRLLLACLLFVFYFSIIWLSICLILIRLITLNSFLKVGLSNLVSFKTIWSYKVSFSHIRNLIISNWYFVVIGSVSIVFWRSANVIISKTLTLVDVANYEISFKMFSLSQLIPVAFATSIYPLMVKMFKDDRQEISMQKVYKKASTFYFLFGLLSYTFIYSFADDLVPFLFGANYSHTSFYTKQMFLTILVFPTAILQANMIIALKLEKFDTIFNIVTLCLNLTLCIVGVYYFKSLSIINVSIFISFVIFHISQDILLINKNIISKKNVLEFYFLSLVSIILFFLFINAIASVYLSFILYWSAVLIYFFHFSKIQSTFREAI